mgnify:CR=1 FL=1
MVFKTLLFRVKDFFALFLLCSCVGESDSTLTDFEGNLRGGLGEKELSLTFDDGPTKHTASILDTLSDYGVKATFFVTGENALKNVELMNRISNEGHLVANHTRTHPSMPNLPAAENIRQVLETHRIIRPYVDKEAFFFRAPYGAWRLWIADVLNDAGLDFYVGNIFWDIGGVLNERYAADWNCWSTGISPFECGRRYLNEIDDRKSGIVLFHDVTANTSRMLKYILPKVLDKGYKISRLDEIAKYKQKLGKKR